MKKYFEIFKYSLKTKVKFLLDYISSLLAFALHVFVFNELWEYILQGKMIEGYNKSQIIWYVIVGEFIIYSLTNSFKKIGEMIRKGEIVNLLLKPINLITYFFVEDLTDIVRVIINFIMGIILGLAMAGPIEVSTIGILIAILSMTLSIVIGILIQLLVGMASFFTEENRSIWLIIQKLCFFVLFTPIEFYPAIIQKILYFLPTTYMVYAPAKIFVHFNVRETIILIGMQLISIIITFLALRFVYKKGVEKISVNGG